MQISVNVYDQPVHPLGCKCDQCKAALAQFVAHRDRKKLKYKGGKPVPRDITKPDSDIK